MKEQIQIQEKKREIPEIEQKIDPMKSSPVVENLELIKQQKGEDYYYYNNEKNIFKREIKKAQLGVFKEKNTGDEFIEKREDYEPERQNAKTEHFISLLVKGVLHSSDFIEKEKRYFSRKMNLKNMENAREGELEAEMFLLRYLFADWDKNVPDRNIIINKDGQFSHYDYGESFRNSQDTMFSFHHNKKLDEKIKRELKLLSKYGETWGTDRLVANMLTILGLPVRPRMKEAEIELKEKAKNILDRIQDDNFFKAIIKKSQLDINIERFNFLKEKKENKKLIEFRDILSERLKLLIKILEERKLK